MPARPKLSDRAARHDPAYLRAKRENFAARAVYKLEEIDRKFGLFRPGGRVIDLGAWPGSWLQYAAQRIGPTGQLYGVDLRPLTIALPGSAVTVVADVFEWVPPTGLTFDVLLSDMAPQTTGDRHNDKWRSEELALRALELATQLLRPGGHMVVKVFQGGRFPELIAAIRRAFQEARPYHAKNTRVTSSEQYLVARGLRANIARAAHAAAAEPGPGQDFPEKTSQGPSQGPT